VSCYHIATSYVTMLLASPEHMFLLQSKRACFPKLEAIKLATADILTGLSKNSITLKWESDSCSSVEISGLDVGWGQVCFCANYGRYINVENSSTRWSFF
jgi:hypothetical protein